MKRFQLKLIALAAVVLGSSGCTVWTVPEFNRVPFNAESGDIVNVEMVPAILDGMHPWDRCMNMGARSMRHETREVAVGTAPLPGTPDSHGEDAASDIILEAVVSVLICESVDF